MIGMLLRIANNLMPITKFAEIYILGNPHKHTTCRGPSKTGRLINHRWPDIMVINLCSCQ